MLANLKQIKREFEDIRTVNVERIKRKERIQERVNSLEQTIQKYKEEIELFKFINRSASDFYRISREENLTHLAQKIGEFMSNVLANDYIVELGIKRRGDFDYLEAFINGLEPRDLSGGEKQVYSLAMVAECSTNGVLMLDETINSLDPIALDTILEYLKEMGETRQIFLIELDDNLDIPYSYISENNTLIERGTLIGEPNI